MSQPELLKAVVAALEQAAIPYMVTGSVVSSFQGEPRASHDVDLVVQLALAEVSQLLRAFPPPRYYVSESAIREAIRDQRMFNLIDTEEGEKADFWLLTTSPFDRSRFARRQRKSLLGVPMMISAPEDTILAKLRWANLSGGSQKQFGDALRVYELQYALIDHGYLAQWAAELGVEDLLARLKAEAVPF